MDNFLSVDLGAESGRVVRGTLESGKLLLDEISRFPTGMTRMNGRLHWDVARLFEEMKSAFKASGSDAEPKSIGVDTWGVDFALLACDGSMLGLPVAYRDPRTDGMMEKFFEIVPRTEVYSRTGIQFMQINTLYQLFAMSQSGSPLLKTASDFLMIPDLFNFLFTGEKTNEFSNATTSQLYNAHEHGWDTRLLEAAGVPPEIMRDVVMPGTIVGELTADMRAETGLGAVPVIAPATHDTGSAVAAVPASGENWAYISSGTWSLMGIETDRPITDGTALGFNFTNEGGVNNTYRFLKNIMGLWIVQRCRAGFPEQHDYATLTAMAADSPAFTSLINASDARFLNPASMPDEIAAFCRETGQPVPGGPGGFVRCALESLALEYRCVAGQLEQVRGKPLERIFIIGGGTQNRLLCAMTADATGLPVSAGPVEATSIGNIIVQARATGHIGSIEEARAVVRESFGIEEYEPGSAFGWDEAFERYMKLKERQ